MQTTSESIPEVREQNIGDALAHRQSNLHTHADLGPQDLVALVKDPNGHVSAKAISTKDTSHYIGSYLYYTGLDNSSASSIAAHLNQLAQILHRKDGQTWFGKKQVFKIVKAVYCSWNAFRGVDVMVIVNLPGMVHVKVIDRQGVEIAETDEIWNEVFVCSVVRALLGPEDDDEQVNSIVESRSLNPFAEGESTAKLFLDCFENVFDKGNRLGCSAESGNVGSLVDNYLIDAFFKAVEITGLWEYSLEVLYRLRQQHESVDFLIAKLLLSHDEEIKAVKVMNAGLQANPRDSNLLVLQSKYLREKGKLELALPMAIQAVNSEPASFKAWLNLSQTYLDSNQINEALLALNSTPMNPYREQSHHKRSTPLRHEDLNLPQPSDVKIPDVDSLNSLVVQTETNESDQTLLNLPASNLKSTFAKAYSILTDIVHRIGWEKLLRYRADIFVMEEEYRTSKSTTSVNSTQTPAYTEEETTPDTSVNSAIDNTSFKKKRLCERWLDHLFLILYDDLRTYTLWQGELMQFEAQNTSYNKTSLEWEHLGMCAQRLHHYREASVAFTQALKQRFAPVSARNLLKFYQREIQTTNERLMELQNTPPEHQVHSPDFLNQLWKKLTTLDDLSLPLLIKLSAWNHRWYSEFATYIAQAIKAIVEREGLLRLKTEIQANYDKEEGVESLMGDWWLYVETFKVEGYDN